MANQQPLPDIVAILRQALQPIDPAHQPVLLAALERAAGKRYRIWADAHPDADAKAGLLACAEREEEIARRIESLVPDAAAMQEKLLAAHPELLTLGRALFDGRSRNEQFTLQAQGERAGAAAWRTFAAAAADATAREVMQSCSPLEEANAEFLQALVAESTLES